MKVKKQTYRMLNVVQHSTIYPMFSQHKEMDVVDGVESNEKSDVSDNTTTSSSVILVGIGVSEAYSTTWIFNTNAHLGFESNFIQ